MLNFLFRRYHYFIVLKIQDFNPEKPLDPEIVKFINRYFFWRGRKVKYFEPYTSKNNLFTYLTWGTAKSSKIINRNCLIFLLELFAYMSNPEQFKVSSEFETITKRINGQELIIYKVKKK